VLLFEFSDAGNRRGRGWLEDPGRAAWGGFYFTLVSHAFAPHARNNSGTTGGVELADMFPSVTWRKSLWSTAGDHSCRGGERRPLQGARA